MSTVVRKGIIELEVRAVKSRLESPQIDAAARAYKETEKATREVEKAQVEVTKTVRESTKATQEFGFKSVGAFREAGEGVFRLTRGLALLSAGGSDDLQRLIRKVALAQGAFDIFAGGLKAFQNLAAFGPLGIGVAAVTTALAAGALMWSRWKGAADSALKATQEGIARNRRELQEMNAAQLAMRESIAEVGIGAALSEDERRRRQHSERARVFQEQMRLEAGQQGAGFDRTDRGVIVNALRHLTRDAPGFTPSEHSRERLQMFARARPDIVEDQLSIEKQLQSVMERRIRLETEAGKEVASRAQAQAAGLAGSLGLAQAGPGGTLLTPIFAQLNAQAQQQVRETITALQQPLDELVERFRLTLERIKHLEVATESANEARSAAR